MMENKKEQYNNNNNNEEEKDSKPKGFWGHFFGEYLAHPMMVFAAIAMGALFYGSALWVIGDTTVSWVPNVIAGCGACVIGTSYFCQDTHALKEQLTHWGNQLQEAKWQKLFSDHFANILIFTTAVIAMVVSWVCPPLFLSQFSASMGLHPVGLAIFSGAAVCIAGKIAQIPYKMIQFFCDHKEDEEKTQSRYPLPLQILDEVLGVIFGIVGAVFTIAATNGPLLELFGAGAAANTLAVMIACFAGLSYFSQDGNSMMLRMKDWAKRLNETGSLWAWSTENKATIAAGVTIAAVSIATLAVVVFWQPPFVQTALSALGLETLSKIGLVAALGVVAAVTSVVGLALHHLVSKQSEYDVLEQDDGSPSSVVLMSSSPPMQVSKWRWNLENNNASNLPYKEQRRGSAP